MDKDKKLGPLPPVDDLRGEAEARALIYIAIGRGMRSMVDFIFGDPEGMNKDFELVRGALRNLRFYDESSLLDCVDDAKSRLQEILRGRQLRVQEVKETKKNDKDSESNPKV